MAVISSATVRMPTRMADMVLSCLASPSRE